MLTNFLFPTPKLTLMLEQDKKDPNPNKKQKLDEHQIDDNVGGVDDPREEEKAGGKPPFSDNEEMEVDDGPAKKDAKANGQQAPGWEMIKDIVPLH